MSKVGIVKDRDFQAKIRLSKGVKLVDFWAPWCGPCKKLGPILEQVAERLGDDAAVYKLNVEDNPTCAAKYRVRSIPTMMVFMDEDLVETVTGLRTADEIEKMVRKYILSE